MGCVIADMRGDFIQTVNAPVDALSEAALAAVMQRHVDAGLAALDASGSRFEARETRFELDMAYLGQTHTVAVPLSVAVAGGRVAPPTRAAIAEAFDAAYGASYGRRIANGVRRVLNLRTAVIGRRPKFDLRALAPQAGATLDAARRGSRPVRFDGRWHETALFARLELPVGAQIAGPAILEQPDTTVLVEPGLVAAVDTFGNVLLAPAGARA